jgi:hypothetical protein
MKTKIAFNGTVTNTSELTIKDVGNCAIEASDADGNYYYLVIITIAGTSYISHCGPVLPDIDEFVDGFTCSLTKVDYKDIKLKYKIDFWLNNRNYNIIRAKTIHIREALSQFRNLNDYILSLVKESDCDSTEDEEEDEDNDDKDDDN